jgi:hypothetical protein
MAQEEINLSKQIVIDNDLIDKVKILFLKASEILPHIVMRGDELVIKISNLEKLPDVMNTIFLFYGSPKFYVINIVDDSYVLTAFY